MSPTKQEQLSRFRESLHTSDTRLLQNECRELIASGIEYSEIAKAIWENVSEKSVADPSWLPAASCVNHADMFAQVQLQAPEDKQFPIKMNRLK